MKNLGGGFDVCRIKYADFWWMVNSDRNFTSSKKEVSYVKCLALVHWALVYVFQYFIF